MSKVNNDNFIKEYHFWRSQHRAKSPETKEADNVALTQFMSVYGNKDLTRIKKEDVNKYLKFLDDFKYTPRTKKEQPQKEPRKYAPLTIFNRKKAIKVMLRWLHKEKGVDDLTGMIDLTNVEKERLEPNILTYDDILHLIGNGCTIPRDRAILAFLLDGGVRRGELLKLKYKEVKFEDNGVAIYLPKGKTKARRVYCVWCTEFMYRWYHDHPTKDPEAYFFCSTRSPFGQFSKQGLWDLLRKIAQRAGYQEHIYTHLFRYSSATIYAQIDGITDQKLKYRYGWKPSSSQADTYIKMSGSESDDDINKAYDKPVGIKIVKGKKLVTCPNCRRDNYENAVECYYCRKALSPEAIAKEREKEEAKKAAEMEEMKKAMAAVAVEAVKNEIASSRIEVDKYFSPGHINDEMTPEERQEIIRKIGIVHEYDLAHDPEYASRFGISYEEWKKRYHKDENKK
jgi:integrase/recombinase XerD